MNIVKIISWVLLYLGSFIPVVFSIFYFSEKNLTPALVASFISMLLYTFLVIKDLRYLSLMSFFTMLLSALLILGVAGKQTDGVLINAFDEKVFMLTLPLIMLFLLINSVFWTRTKQGLKKLIALIFISLSIIILVGYGANLPAYYQNFVYTRINILILFLFSIFIFIKGKKALGILGIILSIGILLLSASMFGEKAYTLSDAEKNEVIAYVDPLAKEMFGYYNKKDYDNFCKYCGIVLKNMMNKDPITIKAKREASGPYTRFDKPSGVIRKSGRFYVEYPIKFQNVKELMYLTFAVENLSSPPIIFGYSLSAKQGLHTNPGNENETSR
jgi:hypothetical protein